MADIDGWDLSGIPQRFWPRVRVEQYTALIVAAIAVKQIADRVGDERGQAVIEAVGAAAADWDDLICGNVPHRIPGPRPHWVALQVAGELVDFADSLPQTSSLRADVAGAASQLTRHAARAMAAGGADRAAELAGTAQAS